MKVAIPRFVRRRYLSIAAAAAVLVAAGALQLADANPAASQVTTLTAWQAEDDPGVDPQAAAWEHAVKLEVPLTAQAGAYAAGGGSIPVVWASALHYKENVYVRVEWEDRTRDESTTRVEDFADAVALEFPARSAVSVPSICMGQADGGVNIWHWRADSDAGVQDPVDRYPNALVDMYPSKDDVFYTARAAGNPYANPAIRPVQALVAQAFGTISPATTQDVKGKGVHANGRWAVVFMRPFASADPAQAGFSPGAKTDMAFAVWNGSEGDRNGRKSASQFVALSIAGSLGGEDQDSTALLMAGAFLVAFTAFSIGLGYWGYREARRTA